MPGFFAIKSLVALFFLYVYTFYYGGGELTADAGRFFQESKTLKAVFHQSPSDYFKFLFGLDNDPAFINKYLASTDHWNAGSKVLPNDSRNVIRVNSILLFISNGQVVIHFLLFSLASFLGGLDLYQFIKKHSKLPKGFLLMLMTLTPSIAFWSSSIIKEPLMILGLCLVLRAAFDNISTKRKTWRYLLGGLLLISFKPYVFICLFAALLFYWVFSRITKSQILNAFIYGALGFGTLFYTGFLNKGVYLISKQQENFMNVRDGGLYLFEDSEHYFYIYYVNRNHFKIEGNQATLIKPVGAFHMRIDNNFKRNPIQLTNVGETYRIGVRMSKAGSGIPITPIKESGAKMIKMIPEVLFNTFIRPVPNKNSSWLQYSAFIENVIILLGLILAIFIFPRKLNSKENRMFFSLMIFSFMIYLIVGWTTPVVGAIVRYVVPGLLGIILIIALQIKTIPKLEKYASFMLKKH
ncbi:MAG: hypothetical protein COA32_10700 [Fluviicola sp.]|nr:MAG: hypothetical protein COA32_10700 [Fluviicola sp.]